MKNSFVKYVAGGLFLVAVVVVSSASAADGTWLGNGSAWNVAGAWSGGTIADGVGNTANFTGVNITGDVIMSLGANRTIGNITFTDDTTSSHNLTLANNTLTLDVTTGAPIIDVTQSDRTLTISSTITGDEGLTKSGIGSLILSGNSGYTGITTVDNGTLTLGNANALGATGAGNGTVINGSSAVAFNGTILNLGSSGLTLSESFSLNGNTTGRATIYNNSSADHVLNGNINVTSDTNHAQIRSDSTGSITVNGDISGTLANGAALFIRGASTDLSTRILGSINIGSAALSKNGTGTWTIGAAGKTYAWGDTLIPEGTLRMGVSNVMPSATVVTFGQSGSTVVTLDLNGNSQTVAGIQLASGSSGTKTITSSTAATLTVGDGNSYSYGGVLTGSLALTKTGAGTLTLSGTNTYTGNTTVSDGTLKVTGTGRLYSAAYNGTAVVTVQSGAILELDTWSYNPTESLGQLAAEAARITINNGTIRMNGTTTYGRGVTVLSGGATFETAAGANWTHGGGDFRANVYTGNPSLTFTGEGTGTFTKVFSGSGSLTKSGAGTWTLNTNNTYSGKTTVSAGVLDVRVASSLSSSSAIQIDYDIATLRLENADNGGSVWNLAALKVLNGTLKAGADGPETDLQFMANGAYTDVSARKPGGTMFLFE